MQWATCLEDREYGSVFPQAAHALFLHRETARQPFGFFFLYACVKSFLIRSSEKFSLQLTDSASYIPKMVTLTAECRYLSIMIR